MSTAVKLFESTQVGAPSLSGTAGNLISLLDACLVNGFNLQTLDSITRVGATATASRAAGANLREHDVVLHAGAAQSEYNGEFRIFNVTSTSYDFTVTGTPATPATGTITSKIAPLGWTKAFGGTNKAAYRSADVTGTQLYLRVDDSNAKYAIAEGYETMTDVDTGTGKFADSTSLWHKSNTADAALKSWTLHGDAAAFYLFTAWGTNSQYEGYFFGDLVSFKSVDAYHCALIANNNTIPSNTGYGNQFSDRSGSTSGKRLARDYSQIGGAVVFSSRSFGYSFSLPIYPSAVDNGMHLTPVYVQGANNHMRGIMPGLFHPVHIYTTLPAHGVIIDNVPDAPGKRFFTQSAGQTAVEYKYAIDITGPWR